MINSQMKLYNYSTFGAMDAYGQPALSEEPVGQVKIAINTSNITTADNIKYKDATYIGLTMDKAISDSWVIDLGAEKLKVLYVNPMGRYKQVFLKEI
jgi:hypothetical protein